METKQIQLEFGSEYKKCQIGDVINIPKNLKLENGFEINGFPVAFKTYGKLNEDKSNAILIFHGLTADQYIAETNPVTKKEGWWEHMVGKKKPIDTDRFFVICPNVLGSCMGSLGPKTINPKTKKPYSLGFPVITILDMANYADFLLEEFGIKKLHSLIGTSMGGMIALQYLHLFPEKVGQIIAISTALKHTAQNIAFNEVGRQAIISDPEFKKGNYYKDKSFPSNGLGIARMIAHITYLSETRLENKFGRSLQNKENLGFGFDVDFKIESYLRHQGFSFASRFDPNSYLYLTRALDYFDLTEVLKKEKSGNSKNSKASQIKMLVVSFSDDWLFPTSEAKQIVKAFSGSFERFNVKEISFIEIKSDKGHDSFLIPNKQFESAVRGFLRS
jgi:homoserine O-acetyltransferase